MPIYTKFHDWLEEYEVEEVVEGQENDEKVEILNAMVNRLGACA